MRRFFLMSACFASILGAEWIGGAEVLYWKPAMSTVPYGEGIDGSNTDPSAFITTFALLPDIAWGGRGWAGWNCGRLCFSVSYLYTKPMARAFVTDESFDNLEFYLQGADGDDPSEPMSQISSQLAVRYQRADVKLAYGLVTCGDFAASAYGFTGWLDLDFNLRADGPAAGADAPQIRFFRYRAYSQGGLLGLGLESAGCLFGGVRGLARGAISMCFLNARIAENRVHLDVTQDFHLQPYSMFEAGLGLEGRLGLEWSRQMGCRLLSVVAAYEVQYYVASLFFSRTIEGVNVVTFNEPNRDIVLPDLMNIGFAGPTLGVSLCF